MVLSDVIHPALNCGSGGTEDDGQERITGILVSQSDGRREGVEVSVCPGLGQGNCGREAYSEAVLWTGGCSFSVSPVDSGSTRPLIILYTKVALLAYNYI